MGVGRGLPLVVLSLRVKVCTVGHSADRAEFLSVCVCVCEREFIVNIDMGWITLVFSAALLSCGVLPALSVEYSLFYIYTALSKPVDQPGISDFTAMGLLDDRVIDYYSSKTQAKVPKQKWMREKMPADYWEKGTQSRRSKEQWFKVNVDILIDRMRDNKTDLHVLQWRHGCVVNEDTDGNIKFVRGVDEYSYDGTEFLSFDEVNSRWIAPVQEAVPTKRKWDDVAILNQYTKGYLEKECVDWLSKFMEYGQEQIRQHSPPVVHIFSKRSVHDPKLETLTCLATGFIPPDAKMYLKKSRTRLPDHLVKSTGIVPNGDGSYQLRSHTVVERDTTVVYECCVTHSALTQPIVKKWVFEEDSGSIIIIIGAAVAGVLILALILTVILILKKKGIICHSTGGSDKATLGSSSNNSSDENIKLKENGSSDSGKDSSNASSENIQENLNEQNQPMLPDEQV